MASVRSDEQWGWEGDGGKVGMGWGMGHRHWARNRPFIIIFLFSLNVINLNVSTF